MTKTELEHDRRDLIHELAWLRYNSMLEMFKLRGKKLSQMSAVHFGGWLEHRGIVRHVLPIEPRLRSAITSAANQFFREWLNRRNTQA